jgi:purine-binding chemotaxis protein CheW
VSSVSVEQVLRMRTHDFECGVDLDRVERVLRLPSLQQVPGGVSFLAGIMNYSGRSVAVVDFGMWLGIERKETYSLDTSVVVCGDGTRRIGLLVDEVAGVEFVEEDDLQMSGAFDHGGAPFSGSLNGASGMAMLLDIERILDIDFSADAVA